MTGCTPIPTPTDPEAGCRVTMPVLGVAKNAQLTTMAGATEIKTRFFTTFEAGNSIVHVIVQSDWDIGGPNKKTYVYSDFTNWQQK
ncbi:MAG: hypothetical protein UV25_C0010G0025 [candidate division WWE3 bacterium GW2011_GWB1_42_41]|nr:MAG: hypothetical protein UV25_C0010G0025 [candidate division WWE3 bacterium GW2011_GWB1_42_41]